MSTSALIDESVVREQAYLLWEREGRPFGRDAEYWLRAEAALAPASTPVRKRAKAAEAPKTKAKSESPGAAKGKPKASKKQ
jgi:hypothetical protein